MIIKAQNFVGWLDISAPELLGTGTDREYGHWLGQVSQYRHTVRAGDILTLPDEYLQFPNIRNAVNAGYLVVMSYNSKDESIVINAEISGFSGSGGGGVVGTRFVFFDIHGGSDTALLKEVDGTPYLEFANNQEDNTTWTVTIPEDYVSGDVYVEVFWSPSNASGGSVAWRLNWKSTPTGSSVASALTASDYTQAAPGTSVLATTGTGLVIPSASIAQNRLLTVEVRRMGKTAADTNTGAARVSLVRLRYTGVIATT